MTIAGAKNLLERFNLQFLPTQLQSLLRFLLPVAHVNIGKGGRNTVGVVRGIFTDACTPPMSIEGSCDRILSTLFLKSLSSVS